MNSPLHVLVRVEPEYLVPADEERQTCMICPFTVCKKNVTFRNIIRSSEHRV